MIRTRRPRLGLLVATLAAALASAVLSGTVPAQAGPATHGPGPLRHACAPAHGRTVTCFAAYRPAAAPHRSASRSEATSPQLTPADIAAAYRLPADVRPNTTVAIVAAYDNPRAEKDLATYRARFGLPPCTKANGCFRKVNQRGAASPLPEGDPGWGVEISLDLDAVSAACPSCRLLLVEADDPDLDAIGAAVNTAVRLGAKVVNNSYGATEFNGIEQYGRRYYTHPGVAQVASSGDDGFVIPSAPAVFGTVTAVGGTSLTRSTNSRGWAERVWEYAGSGCSGYVAKPAWQHDTHCPMRTVADVAAVADPDSGFLVYDTYGLGPDNGYLAVGGTSLSAPLVAGMIARAGRSGSFATSPSIYRRAASFFDVVGGSNGDCGGDYLCTGRKGYDAPTGVGTPNGVAGLQP